MIDTNWLSWLEYKRFQDEEFSGNYHLDFLPEPKKILPTLPILHHFTILNYGRLQSLEIAHSRDLCAFGDSRNGVTLYDVRTQNTSYIGSFPGNIFDVTFGKNNQLLGISDEGVFAGHSGQPNTSWEKLYQTPYKTQISSISYHPKSNHIIAGDEQGSIYFVPESDWSKIEIFEKFHRGEIGCSTITPDGKWAVLGSDDGVVSVWDLDQWKQVNHFYHPGVRDGVVLENLLFLVGEEQYTLYEFPSFTLKWETSGQPTPYPLADISPNRKHCLVSLSKGLHLFDFENGKELANYRSRPFLCVSRFLYDNRIVALYGQKEFIILDSLPLT